MPGLSVLPVEVGPVAVLVPPGAFVRERAVGDGDVIVPVLGGEGAALVVDQGIACDWTQGTVSHTWVRSDLYLHQRLRDRVSKIDMEKRVEYAHTHCTNSHRYTHADEHTFKGTK